MMMAGGAAIIITILDTILKHQFLVHTDGHCMLSLPKKK
jgi:hypothetical protein